MLIVKIKNSRGRWGRWHVIEERDYDSFVFACGRRFDFHEAYRLVSSIKHIPRNDSCICLLCLRKIKRKGKRVR